MKAFVHDQPDADQGKHRVAREGVLAPLKAALNQAIREKKPAHRRARAKVAVRSAPRATEEELKHGVPIFLGWLADTLKLAAER